MRKKKNRIERERMIKGEKGREKESEREKSIDIEEKRMVHVFTNVYTLRKCRNFYCKFDIVKSNW